ncbi:MAG: MarR family winged helix-turn-helix transcriptional regulator, partial [Eubacterium sp.]
NKNNAEHMADYKSMDTDNQLIINLRDSGHTLRFLFEGKGSQKRILIILNEVGTITQHQLTERLGIKPGSASEVIAKLEDSGLIQRTPSTSDRRTTDLKLTEAGKQLADEALQQRKQRHQEMFSCLSEEEKATLLSLLEKVNTDWNSRYGDSKELCPHEEHHKEHRHRGPHHHRLHHKL